MDSQNDHNNMIKDTEKIENIDVDGAPELQINGEQEPGNDIDENNVQQRVRREPTKCEICRIKKVNVNDVKFHDGITKKVCDNCAFFNELYQLLIERDEFFERKLEIIPKLAAFFNYKRGTQTEKIISSLFQNVFLGINPKKKELKEQWKKFRKTMSDDDFNYTIELLQNADILGSYLSKTDEYLWGKFVQDLLMRHMEAMEKNNKDDYFYHRGKLIRMIEALSGFIHELSGIAVDSNRVMFLKQLMSDITDKTGKITERCKIYELKKDEFVCMYEVQGKNLTFVPDKEESFYDELMYKEPDIKNRCGVKFSIEEDLYKHLSDVHGVNSGHSSYVGRDRKLESVAFSEDRLKKKLNHYNPESKDLATRLWMRLLSDEGLIVGNRPGELLIDPYSAIIFEKALIKQKELSKDIEKTND